MKHFNFFLLFFLGSLALPASGNEPVNFPEVDGWELSVYEDVYTPGNLWDLINGAAESYLAYHFIDLHLADYNNGSGIIIHAEVYRHSSLNNAYGIYASERSSDYSFIDVGGQAYTEEGILNLFTGPYYIKLYSTDENEDLQEGLQTLGKAIVKAQGQGNTLPELLSLFPEKGKLPYSDQYIAQNFIGFDFLHSAFTSSYKEGYRLFIINGRDADEILKMVRSYLDFTHQKVNHLEETHFVIQDPYNGSVPVIIYDNYLIGILEGPENQNARMGLAELERNLKTLD